MRIAALRDAKNGGDSPVERLNAVDDQDEALAFQCPRDVVHPLRCFIEKGGKLKRISFAFSPHFQQMASYHFHQISRY